MSIKRDFERFGQKVRQGFQRFGQKAGRDFQSAGKFIKEKALPAIEKVAGQVGRGVLQYGLPIASVVAPELLPLVAGAGALASRVGSAAGTGRKLITAGEKVVGAVKSGNVGKIATAGLEGRQALRRAGVRGA
jgi:hypothetical protein